MCILLVAGILRESDKAQDIRTHKYYATHVRHTAPVSKSTYKFPTAKEVTDESATFQFQCATICWCSNRFRIYAWRATNLPLLHTKTGFCVTQPETKGMLLQIPWSESWLLTWTKCCGQDSLWCTFLWGGSGMDSRVVVWIREFLLGLTQRVRVGEQLSAEVRVTSVVLQGSVLGPLLFLVYVNDIWRNMESTIRFLLMNV